MKILVIEDELHLATYIKKGLASEGFVVTIEMDGLEGYYEASTGEYDAITLDIMLPSMNGYEVCKRLREDGIATPILMLTAKDGEYDEADALDTGADDFLRKPFSLVVLIARLRALIRRGKADSDPMLKVGDLTLDQRTKTAVRNDKVIELAPREYALLEYLMHNVDVVVSKRQILDHVWGVDFDGEENVVEVYIRYLRKKIDQPFDKPLIDTVRLMGYRISDR